MNKRESGKLGGYYSKLMRNPFDSEALKKVREYERNRVVNNFVSEASESDKGRKFDQKGADD